MPKLLFAAQQYALLLLLVAAAWGFGRAALRLLQPAALHGPLRHAVPLAAGLGLAIVLLQALALAGWLRALPIALAAGAGVVLAAREAARGGWRAALAARRQAWSDWPPATRLLAATALVLAASTLLKPLAPPRAWDELMYHLPHAAEWAASGRLTVNDWLRYPWFPYNYNLLYAAALVAGSDVLAHLVHALAGWIAALLLFAWARPHFGANRALFAVLLWLLLARGQFDTAYVDLGVALFALLALVALDRWREERASGWLLLCAFALGVAAGAKYQALALLPFFAAGLWRAWPRPGLLLAAAIALLLPCAWWYGRNLVLAGDPVAPLGGRLFGFSDWNLADYRKQLEDIARAAAAPPLLVWPALLGVAQGLLRERGGARLAAAFAAWALLVWAATSRYPRYLVPAYPVLAVFAVLGWEQLARLAGRALRVAATPGWARAGAGALLAVTLAAGVTDLARAWRVIAPTPESRDALLSGKITGYAMWKYLREHPQGRIYQFGLEDGLYYAPRPIWGEVFGPWRYADYAALDAPALHARLAREGFDAVLVHTGRLGAVVARPGFDRHFEPVHREGEVMLFAIRKEPRHD